jgi:hypothetical protein
MGVADPQLDEAVAALKAAGQDVKPLSYDANADKQDSLLVRILPPGSNQKTQAPPLLIYPPSYDGSPKKQDRLPRRDGNQKTKDRLLIR